MKSSISLLLAVTVALTGLVGLTHATDVTAKAVTLTGTLTCAECQLRQKTAKPHQDVLLVKEGEKEVAYYVTGVPNHPNVCHQRIQNVKVTGTLEEKDGTKCLAASKLELPAM